eukprot:90162-Prorocentrum_minimum.AAC.3
MTTTLTLEEEKQSLLSLVDVDDAPPPRYKRNEQTHKWERIGQETPPSRYRWKLDGDLFRFWLMIFIFAVGTGATFAIIWVAGGFNATEDSDGEDLDTLIPTCGGTSPTGRMSRLDSIPHPITWSKMESSRVTNATTLDRTGMMPQDAFLRFPMRLTPSCSCGFDVHRLAWLILHTGCCSVFGCRRQGPTGGPLFPRAKRGRYNDDLSVLRSDGMCHSVLPVGRPPRRGWKLVEVSREDWKPSIKSTEDCHSSDNQVMRFNHLARF